MSFWRQLLTCLFVLTLVSTAHADPDDVTVGFDRLPEGGPANAGDRLGGQFEAVGVAGNPDDDARLVQLPANEVGSRPLGVGGEDALQGGIRFMLVNPTEPELLRPRAEVSIDILSLGASRVRVVALDANGEPDPNHDAIIIDATDGDLVVEGDAERIDGPTSDTDVLGIGYRDRATLSGASIYGLLVIVEEDFNGDAIYLDDLRYAVDNCPDEDNEDQQNTDDDGLGDVCDPDLDGDGVDNDADNCPRHANADQNDHDDDGLGDVCSPDADEDGIPRDFNGDGETDTPCRGGVTANCDDNCPLTPNPDQRDSDVDGIGNACDPDVEGDGILNDEDNCPETTNPDQADLDEDGMGDLCDDDDDGDDVEDTRDNCVGVHNPDQANLDEDREGDACDDDDDGDTRPDDTDNCPQVPNEDQGDADFDGIGDVCDTDSDNDGVDDDADNCPTVENADQADFDSDGSGDACDIDDDGDDIDDLNDNCPNVPNADQRDSDEDDIGDACDPDPDGDTFLEDDNCPSDYNPDQLDSNGNGIGDACDSAGSGDDGGDNEGCGCATQRPTFWGRWLFLRR